MPDFLDHVQDRLIEQHEALQRSARLKDVPIPDSRDCCGCGNEIDPRRLRAVPTALRCTPCEELQVQRQSFTGRPRA